MEYRQLGKSGLKVPELCFGAGTFGAANEFFKAWSETTQEEANRIVDICMDAGINLFDTADIYSDGESEKALGVALSRLKREDVMISTKATFRFGKGPNDVGSSRYHLIQSVERSLKRLGTDYIDIYHLHAFDATSPVEETLRALDDLVREGKIRYIACSNFSAWQAMKAAGISREYRIQRFEAVEALYSLGARDVEREIVPMLQDQFMSLMVWGPLSSGILSGKYDRSGHGPAGSRLTFDQDQMLKSDLVAGD